jgi:hypothetical protein
LSGVTGRLPGRRGAVVDRCVVVESCFCVEEASSLNNFVALPKERGLATTKAHSCCKHSRDENVLALRAACGEREAQFVMDAPSSCRVCSPPERRMNGGSDAPLRQAGLRVEERWQGMEERLICFLRSTGRKGFVALGTLRVFARWARRLVESPLPELVAAFFPNPIL